MKTTTRIRITVLVALVAAVAGVVEAHGSAARRAAPSRVGKVVAKPVDRAPAALTAEQCRSRLSDPLRLARLWIRNAAYGAQSPCRLAARGYTTATPRFGRYRIAYASTLPPRPGHRLYLVYLVGKHRIGRFVLDLAPGRDRRWYVDLWADM
jgi:hypothetical protein